MGVDDTLKAHRDELLDAFGKQDFIVFLCGPSLSLGDKDAAARARKRIKEALECENFQVVLGEDDGLDSAEIKTLGIDAQDNELEFIRGSCNAVVIVAASAGSFCELGLFSWHFVHKHGLIDPRERVDLVLLVDRKFESHKSYLNQGPAHAVKAFGLLEYVDFETYDAKSVVTRLKTRRATFVIDRRGRPKKKK